MRFGSGQELLQGSRKESRGYFSVLLRAPVRELQEFRVHLGIPKPTVLRVLPSN